MEFVMPQGSVIINGGANEKTRRGYKYHIDKTLFDTDRGLVALTTVSLENKEADLTDDDYYAELFERFKREQLEEDWFFGEFFVMIAGGYLWSEDYYLAGVITENAPKCPRDVYVHCEIRKNESTDTKPMLDDEVCKITFKTLYEMVAENDNVKLARIKSCLGTGVQGYLLISAVIDMMRGYQALSGNITYDEELDNYSSDLFAVVV